MSPRSFLTLSLPLVLLLVLGGVRVAGRASDGERYLEVPLRELVDELPEYRPSWRLAERARAMRPYAVLDGEGEAWFGYGVAEEPSWFPPPIGSGSLLLAVPAEGEVTGRLFVPTKDWRTMQPYPFRLAADRPAVTRADFLRARVACRRELVERRVPGAAWFRHGVASDLEELDEAPEEPAPGPWTPAPPSELQDTLALFLGGRAISENLQLDRLLPITGAEEGTVDVDELEGIEVRPFDWKPLLAEEPPALDALAAFVPSDQHVLLFPSFAALAAIHDELGRSEDLLASFDERGLALAGLRDRYLAQLALPWNALVKAFGQHAIQSVAVTGGDPYFPSGTDVAVLLETSDPETLLGLLEIERRAALARLGGEGQELAGEVEGVAYRGLSTPGRSLSSLAADLGGVVCVTNSREGLAAVARAAAGSVPRLGALDEFRFFRQRYALDRERSAALLVVPDGAIRRWCGPRWRIGASRRVRATAVLLDLQATFLPAVLEGREVRLAPDPRFPLGGLQLLEAGVTSSEYGSLAFGTPIRELALDRIGEGEANLYRTWREGYQRAWSNFFDPIAAELDVSEGALALDVSVLPILEFSDYDTFRSLAGERRLGPTDGDPHEDALVHVTMVLDREAQEVRMAEGMAMAMLPGVEANPLSWVGDHVSVYLDRDEAFLARMQELAGSVPDGASPTLLDDLSSIPVALHVDVASGLKLAAFLGALRAYVEQNTPGLVEWQPDTEGELRFVRVTSEDMGEDISLYYGTTSEAWVLSPNRATLVRAMRRDAARRAGAEAGEAPARREAAWGGASVGFELDLSAASLFPLLEGRDPTEGLRLRAWSFLPVLNAWHRLAPDTDPADLHERFWGQRPSCPGGGRFEWMAGIGSMISSVFGAPAEPRPGVVLPPGLAAVKRVSAGLTFEHDGLRARARAER